MAASSKPTAHRNLYRNNDNRSVVVEFVSTAEMRVGETRWTAVIYARGQMLYVRPLEEFHAKFTLQPSPAV
jgi:hypothetical protein